jgi:hypothetical protein
MQNSIEQEAGESPFARETTPLKDYCSEPIPANLHLACDAVRFQLVPDKNTGE